MDHASSLFSFIKTGFLITQLIRLTSTFRPPPMPSSGTVSPRYKLLLGQFWIKELEPSFKRNSVNVFYGSSWITHLWPNQISNVELHKKTGCNNAVLEIKRRRLRWLGHVLRMPKESIPKVALSWTPSGRRKPGRRKTTWRKTAMAEL